MHGKLVYFAGYKAHIGLYPTASGIKAFQNEIAAFGYSKGAIRFPLDQPLPQALITRIVKYRLKENLEKASFKTAKTTKLAKNSKPAKRKKP